MADARTLSDHDMTYLRQAGQYRMLRDLSGWKVGVTGRTSMQRSQLAVLIEAAGGIFTNVAGAGVNLLVVADDTIQWTAKMQAAEDTGTKVLRESDFAAELLPTPAELLAGVRARFGTAR